MDNSNEARALLRQGRLLEAECAYARILEASPDDAEALNVVALAALRDGDATRALGLLRHAATITPLDAQTQFNLGRALEIHDDLAAASICYQQAVRLQPEFFLARLHLGSALERRGKNHSAALNFTRALQCAQANGRWLNPATTPAGLRPLVEHAVIAADAGRRAAYDRALAPLVKRYGRAALTRIEQGLRIYLGDRQAEYPDPRQRPTFFCLPGLPTAAYLDRAAFTWLPALEQQTAAARRELHAVLGSTAGSERVFTSDELEVANLRGEGQRPSWTGYYFYRHGVRRADNCTACPDTARALDALPLCRIREHGPEVLFSVFTPGTHLLPHRGVTNVRCVAHLPLIVPEDCALSVGGEIHVWQEDQVVVFDDTYEHEAWNRSRRIRVVLIADVWNPHLTEVERAAATELIEAIGDFRAAAETA